MIVDSSALIALILREAQVDEIKRALDSTAVKSMSVSNYLEVNVSLRRKRLVAVQKELPTVIDRLSITLSAVDERQVAVAIEADARYGRGSGHAAQLNYGDCFAYALAKVRGEPLLFVGDDFSHTDLTSALG